MNAKRTAVTLSIILILLQGILFPFGKNKVNYTPINWKTLKTVHFSLYYPDGMEDLAFKTARTAEEGYIHIANYLNHELTKVVPIVLFPFYSEFQNNNILPEIVGEQIGGFTEPIKNRIVIPYTGSDAELRHVVTHELTHAFQFNILLADTSGDTGIKLSTLVMPLWLIEGMAEYLSLGYDETTDMVMRDVILNDRFATINDLSTLRIKSYYLIYKEGQAFYNYFETNYGKQSIGELLRDMRDIGDIDIVFKVHTGKTMGELNEDFFRFYKRKYYDLIKEKKFDNEESQRITDHEETKSLLNVYPAISPDGEKIAYITNRNIYTDLVIMNITKGKKNTRTIIRGNRSANYEELHIRNNSLSWSSDNTSLAFVAQSNGKDTIFIVNPDNGSIKKEITLPFSTVMDPCLSGDGNTIAFSAATKNQSDIYIYSLRKNSLKRITNDNASDRYPKFSPDENYLYFSTKSVLGSSQEKDDYDIVRVAINTTTRESIIDSPGNDIQPDISPDGTELLFSSNKSGIYNLYKMRLKDKQTEKCTDVITGVFAPRWFPDGKQIAYVAYQRLGYDLYTKDITQYDSYQDSEMRETISTRFSYPTVTLTEDRFHFSEYEGGLSPDWLSLGLAGSFRYGLIGFAQATVADYLGNHKIIATANYFRADEKNKWNVDLSYYFLKLRWDFGIGIFYQRNPLWLLSLDDLNDIVYTIRNGTEQMSHYGGYVETLYPFSRYFSFMGKLSMSRYETDCSESDERHEIHRNLSQLSFSLVYDNVLLGRLTLLDGFRGTITFEQSASFTGRYALFSNINMDVRQYFFISKMQVLALRFASGIIAGHGSDDFHYYLGGYTTLRGYDLFSFNGRYMFLFSAEFRFTLIEALRTGWPFYLSFGDIGGVLFIDAGSAWNKGYGVYNKREGHLEDLKTDFGCGLRFVIYPLVILKLDFAWPYDTKTLGKPDILFSLGLDF